MVPSDAISALDVLTHTQALQLLLRCVAVTKTSEENLGTYVL